MVSINLSSNFTFGFNGDSQKTEQEDRINKMRNDFNIKLEAVRQERTRVMNERDSLVFSISKYQQEVSEFRSKIVELSSKIEENTAQVRKLESNGFERNRKLNEIQNKLFESQSNLQIELQDDDDYLNKLNSQTNLINILVSEIENWKANSHHDTDKKLELEQLIISRKEEIQSYQSQISSLEKEVSELENTIFSFDSEFEKIADQYNAAVNERDQAQFQLSLKLNQVKELENRINSNSQRIQAVTKTVEEYRTRIANYEDKCLQMKSATSGIEVQINILVQEGEQQNNKISVLEEYVKKRDEKIAKFMGIIKEKEETLKLLQENNKKSNGGVLELRKILEQKCQEMQQWQEENLRDDSKIQELTSMINFQIQTISHWEEENERDNNRIVGLENELTSKNDKLSELKIILNELREKYNDIYSSTNQLEIIEEHRQSEFSYSQESCYEIYQKIYTEDQARDILLNQAFNSLNAMRARIGQLINDKYELKAKIENYKTFMKMEKESTAVIVRKSEKLEEKVCKKMTVQQSNSNMFNEVEIKVNHHKDQNNEREREILNIFEEIDNVLAI